MFKKVLIANRGEIAIRVIRACKELGIKTVAVHSEADAGAIHTRFADEAICIGPASIADSYLNIPAIISAAEVSAADAIHPGYGFHSENPKFAQVVIKCGLGFIGPSPDAINLWCDKLRAREAALKFGLPVLAASGALSDVRQAVKAAAAIGYPVVLKARGGGSGLRIARTEEEVTRAFESALAEVPGAHGPTDFYLERFVENARQIEFQALADRHKQVWTLGERECSVQRKQQKLVEESPSPAISESLRSEIGDGIRRALLETDFVGLASFEFLLSEDGTLSFLETNATIQVGHPVTEMVTGVDLVVEQIRAAAGEKLDLPDTRNWKFRGHAIECRILAEDPELAVLWPGKITEYYPPGGTGVRVDSGVFGGWVVPSTYDSLVAKVIVHAPTRALAIGRMQRALDEYIIGGIRTNLRLQKAVLQDAQMIAGTMTTQSMDRVLHEWKAESQASST